MKIAGQSLGGRNTAVVELRRPELGPVHLTVQALPLGFESLLAQRGVRRPAVPQRVARDARGKVIRDETGQAVLHAEPGDADYLRCLEEYARRTLALEVVEGLAADASVSFETTAPDDDGDWAAYADRVYEELKAAGFSDGDLVVLVQAIHRVSNLTGEAIAAAQNDFFPDRPEATR